MLASPPAVSRGWLVGWLASCAPPKRSTQSSQCESRPLWAMTRGGQFPVVGWGHSSLRGWGIVPRRKRREVEQEEEDESDCWPLADRHGVCGPAEPSDQMVSDCIY
ncbi:unnamed protein product [Musa hybrid cultivar]